MVWFSGSSSPLPGCNAWFGLVWFGGSHRHISSTWTLFFVLFIISLFSSAWLIFGLVFRVILLFYLAAMLGLVLFDLQDHISSAWMLIVFLHFSILPYWYLVWFLGSLLLLHVGWIWREQEPDDEEKLRFLGKASQEIAL